MLSNQQSIILYKPNQENDKQFYLQQVIKGLTQSKKFLPSHYRYDQQGSQICSDINSVQEYYVTRQQISLLKSSGSKLLQIFGRQKFNLVDLGAGSGVKTTILLEKAVKQKYNLQYIPQDISYDSNIELCKNISHIQQNFKTTVLTSLFQDGIKWVNTNKREKNIYYFLGGTLGNSTQEQNHKFIQFVSQNIKQNDLFVVHYHLMTNPQAIQKCYFNSSGLQFKFILNQLKRINRQLKGNIDLNSFYPHSYFDPYTRCQYGCIISKKQQNIKINNIDIKLKKGQVIKASQSKRFYSQQVDQFFLNKGFVKIDELSDQKKVVGCNIYRKIEKKD